MCALRNWTGVSVTLMFVAGLGGQTEAQGTSGCLSVGQLCRGSWAGVPFDKERRWLHLALALALWEPCSFVRYSAVTGAVLLTWSELQLGCEVKPWFMSLADLPDLLCHNRCRRTPCQVLLLSSLHEKSDEALQVDLEMCKPSPRRAR